MFVGFKSELYLRALVKVNGRIRAMRGVSFPMVVGSGGRTTEIEFGEDTDAVNSMRFIKALRELSIAVDVKVSHTGEFSVIFYTHRAFSDYGHHVKLWDALMTNWDRFREEILKDRGRRGDGATKENQSPL